MRKIREKIPAKINLTLDVTGVKDGYHEIKSLFCSINVFDKITVKKRSDKKITLKEKGILTGISMTENNAYRAAALYRDTFGTAGVDIVIDKNIPIGAGLGGSSADIAGVLNAMDKIFNAGSVKKLADELGSDVAFMLHGGLSEVTGRGETVKPILCPYKFYLLIITENESVGAKEGYAAFDRAEKTYQPCTEKAEIALKNGETERFYKLLKNDLYNTSAVLVPKIKENVKALKKAGAVNAVMTGSGSAVVGYFADKKRRNAAVKTLKNEYKHKLIFAETI